MEEIKNTRILSDIEIKKVSGAAYSTATQIGLSIAFVAVGAYAGYYAAGTVNNWGMPK
ncbi:hypothetical protein ACSSD7_001935 [Vibrio cholerae]